MSMRLAFVADVHLGNHRWRGQATQSGVNARARLVSDVIKRAVAQAAALQCDELIVLGDLFDTSHPAPQLIKLAQDSFREDLPTLAITGNHDEDSTDPGDHALGPLTASGMFKVADGTCFYTPRPTYENVQIGLVPYRPGPAHEWFPGAVADAFQCEKPPVGVRRLLAFHLGVSDADTAHFLQGAEDSIGIDVVREVCMRHGVTGAFCGNWHTRKRWDFPELSVLQVGTLCPTGFDNPGVQGYGTLAVWDSQATTPKAAITHLVLPGPRFIQVDKPKDFPELAKTARRSGCTVFARMKVPADLWPEAVEITTGWMDAGLAEFAEPVLDDEEAKSAAREAVQAARGSETLDQAFAAYVGEMPLEPGVQKGAVLAEVQSCMLTAAATG